MSAKSAQHLPRHQGPAAWADILEDSPRLDTLREDRKTDVAVIGAGFAGLAAARRLRQLDPALKVLVLEAGRIAEGATGRNSGFMIDIPHELTSEDYAGSDDARLIGFNRAAQRFAAEAVEDYAIPAAFFDRAGKINGAARAAAEAHNAALAVHLDHLGEPYERLDAAQMSEITGSAHYRAGLYTPGTILLQPAGFVRGLASGLVRDGVAICEGSPVLGFAPEGAAWRLNLKRGVVRAGRVILAVNGHLESFGFARDRLIQLFLFGAMTPRLDPGQVAGEPRWGVTPSDPMGTTLRRIDAPQGGDRIVVRSCTALRPGMAATRADLARAGRVMQRKFAERFPELATLRMEHVWAGHLCLSRNGVSVTRQIAPGLFAACVQNGLGTTRGTLAGIAAAEAALGVASDIRAWFESQEAPTALPPQPLRSWGGNALLRWKEWRAAAE